MATIDKIRVNGTDYTIGGSGGGSNIVELTQQQYDDLQPKDPDTMYVISDAEAVDVSGFATKDELKEKQDKMTGNYLSKVDVGGSSISIETKAFVNEAVQKTDTINFKTINGNAIFGIGDIKIEGGGGSDAKVWTVSNLESGNIHIVELPFDQVKIGDIVQTFHSSGTDRITDQYAIIAKSLLPEQPVDWFSPQIHLALIKRNLTGDGTSYELLDLRISYSETNYTVTKTDIGGSGGGSLPEGKYVDRVDSTDSFIRFNLKYFDGSTDEFEAVNFKTINNQPIIGSGNIEIEGGGGSEPRVWDVSSLEESSLLGSELPFSEVKIGDIVQTSSSNGVDNITNQYVIIAKSSLPQDAVNSWAYDNHLGLIKRKLTGDGTSYELLDLRINGDKTFQTWGNYTVTKTDVGNAYTKTQSDARYIQKGGLKTVNGQSLEGSGNIDIEGGGGSLPEGNYYYDSSFVTDWSTGKDVSNLILKRKRFDGSNDSEDNYFFSSINGKTIMSTSPWGLNVTNFELVTQEEFDNTVGDIETLLSRI